jgi:hypothetical protein
VEPTIRVWGSGTTCKQPANLAVEGAEESLSILPDYTPTVRPPPIALDHLGATGFWRCHRAVSLEELPCRRQCELEGCTKLARTGGHCAAHGGGKRCQHEGCSKSAIGDTEH